MMPGYNRLLSGCQTFPRILNIAHRGARAFAPENTLPAFEKAKTLRCSMFELDVHLSKDRELVVHHDDDLTRCTDVTSKFPSRRSYFVSDFNYEELLTLDAGTWYVKQIGLPASQRQPFLRTLTDDEIARFVKPDDLERYSTGCIKIPSLRQVLEFAITADIMVDIEIKTIPRMYHGITEDVVELVESMGLEHRVMISSFDHEQLSDVRRKSNLIATGVLTSDRLAKPGEYLQLIDADYYNPGCYGDYDSLGFGSVTGELDLRAIISVQSVGRGTNVWTCNDKKAMRQLISAGVTGLITDFPNRVQEVLEELS